MTTVYFIRHAESDTSVRDGRIRPLTENGLAKRALVTAFLQNKNIDAVLSSPFKRAIDTVADFADGGGFAIDIIEDFREQRSSSDMRRSHPGFDAQLQRQWMDFAYAFSDGESMGDVQRRNMAALEDVLARYRGRNIVIGTHGTALSLIINHYDATYGYEDFKAMEHKLPWAVRMVFDEAACLGIEKIDLY